MSVVFSVYSLRIFLPIVAYRIVNTMVSGDDNGTNSSFPASNDNFTSYATREDIATFGFLLGTFPTAPTVFVFASQYHLAMETVRVYTIMM